MLSAFITLSLVLPAVFGPAEDLIVCGKDWKVDRPMRDVKIYSQHRQVRGRRRIESSLPALGWGGHSIFR
jgi:hypothetical protein